jgi:hypothetical protein
MIIVIQSDLHSRMYEHQPQGQHISIRQAYPPRTPCGQVKREDGRRLLECPCSSCMPSS